MASSNINKPKADTPVKNTTSKNVNKPITLESIWSVLSNINDKVVNYDSDFNNINIKLSNLKSNFNDFNNSMGLLSSELSKVK